jgi:hypothetical protein
MKRNLILVVMVVIAIFAVTGFMIYGTSSAEDYKVIKNAVGEKKTSGEVTMLRIEVTDKKAKKVEVNLKVPLSLVEMLSDFAKDNMDNIKIDGKTGGKCNIDFKKIVAELKKSGPMSLIEVDTEDNLVKIWIE